MYFDYYADVKDDIIDFIDGNIDYEDFDSLEELEDYILENEYNNITGNADGSHTYSRIEASENLSNNFDLLAEALNDFCLDVDFLSQGAEACDVLIRMYVFPESLRKALQEIEEDFKETHDKEESEDEEEDIAYIAV